MSDSPSSNPNLSALGRELLATGGSKPSGPWIPPTAEELGKLLPEYDIVKMLGRGGMGAVYMGRQKSLDRPVAIKILSNTLDEADASFAERFKNEARAMGKLNHPGIVAVHDFGETGGGLLYIVMEYVEGTDVARMIAKEGRLHTEHAMAITAHVCDALAYAHERGIIHRDIKPANIMVGYDGVVKVADFGLAKVSSSGATSGLTQSNVVMGTLHYMAPESLLLGTAVDHRADIYAVGVMLYQMLTGKIPQGMFELPSLQVNGLDPRYDGIIAKALREDRDKRYASAIELRHDLDGILTQPVVKVEENAEEAPAALPTQARPQRPGGKAYRPPQSVVHHKTAAKSGASWAWVALLPVVALGVWLWMNRDNAVRQPNEPGQQQTSVRDTQRMLPAPSSASANTTVPSPLDNSKVPMTAAPPTATLTPQTQAKGKAAPDPDDQWQDLMRRLANSADIKTGVWSYENGVLQCADSKSPSCLAIRTNVDDSFTVRLRFSSDQFYNVAAISPTPESRMTFSLGTRNMNVSWATTGPPGHGKVLNNGLIHELTMEVSPALLRTWIDGTLVFDLPNPAWKEAPKPENYPPGNDVLVGFGATGAVSFHSFEVKGLALNSTSHMDPMATQNALASAVFQLPDFRLRVANYQKARHAQLSELSGKYRNALTAARAEMAKGGVLAEVTALDDAITRTTALADEIEQNLSSIEIKPLTALPELGVTVPQRLKDLRAIFEREVAKIETTLVASLDPSLATVQTTLVQADKLGEAKAVEDFRKNLLRVFGMAQPAESSPEIAVSTNTPVDLKTALLNYRWEWRHRDLAPDLLTFGTDGVARCERFHFRWQVIDSHSVSATDNYVQGKLQANWNAVLKFDPSFASFSAEANNGRYRYSGKRLESLSAAAANKSSPKAPTAPSPLTSLPAQARIIQRVVAIQNVCAWPNLTLMPDGSVTAIVFNQPNHGITPGDLDCYASSDGLKWEKRGAVTAHEPDTIRMNHAAGLAGNGDLIVLCSGWTNVKQPQRPKQQPFRDAVLRSWVLRSKDGGRSWGKSEVFPATESADWSDYVPFGDIWKAQDGTLRASCYQEHYVNPAQSIKSSGMRAWCFRSDDDGATWKPQALISPTHNETSLFPLGGKSWLAAARDSQVDLIQSDDDGATWGQPTPATERSEVNGHLTRLADKRLLLSYGVRSRSSQGVCAKLSSDEGRTWSPPIRLADSLESDCGYPSSVQLANGRIVTAYYSKRSSDYNGYHMGVVVWELAASSSASVTPIANPPQASASNFAAATKDIPFVNSLGMKFVPVPGTKVLMCIHETRKGDYAAYATANPSVSDAWRNVDMNGEPVSNADDHPVVEVAWSEAKTFCDWLGTKDKLVCRLPTDREWSFAVGIGPAEDQLGGNFTPEKLHLQVAGYPWGSEAPGTTSKRIGNYADASCGRKFGFLRNAVIKGYNDGFATTAPVMSFDPNPLGIYDLGGNVHEWCADFFDGTGPLRVSRGGCFHTDDPGGELMSSRRAKHKTNNGQIATGFRVVIELP